MNPKTQTRLSLSRVQIRTVLLATGVLTLLIWSLPGSASLRSRSDKALNPEAANVSNAFNSTMVPFKPASANLDQVRNGAVGCDDTVPNSCTDPADWVNGNAGASNAHY